MSDDDNRKRVHQQDEVDMAISSKRAALGANLHDHYGGGYQQTNMYGNQNNNGNNDMDDNEDLMFKLLCPQAITGLIIGRAGSIINQLNATTGAKIKLSQNTEHFPGTSDRVLLLVGPREGISNAVKELVSRIIEAPEKKPHANNPPMIDMYGNPVTPANRGPQGTFLIRVLIPKNASAAIIGKGGSVIKHMGEVSSCKFQLGDETDPFNTKERIVAITGPTVPAVVIGAQTIMVQLLQDARIRNYPNTTTNYGVPPNMGMMQPGMPAPPMGGPGGFKGHMGMPGGMGMPGAPYAGAPMNAAPYVTMNPYVMTPYAMHPGMMAGQAQPPYNAGVMPQQHQQYYAAMGQAFPGGAVPGQGQQQGAPANAAAANNASQQGRPQQQQPPMPHMQQQQYYAMPGYEQYSAAPVGDGQVPMYPGAPAMQPGAYQQQQNAYGMKK